SDRRIPDRLAASTRCRGNPHRSAFCRIACANLGRAARRSAERLSTAEKGGMTMWNVIKPNQQNLRIWQAMVLVVFFAIWHFATLDPQAAFFFGEPLKVLV